jgi:succinate dehydrogenase hydrophobic anchor subunit
MGDLKETLAENKLVRWFLRSLTGLLLIFYTGYIMYSKVTTGTPNMNAQDWSIVLGGIVVWAAWEAIRPFLLKKAEKLS